MAEVKLMAVLLFKVAEYRRSHLELSDEDLTIALNKILWSETEEDIRELKTIVERELFHKVQYADLLIESSVLQQGLEILEDKLKKFLPPPAFSDQTSVWPDDVAQTVVVE